MANVPTSTWSETSPAGSDNINAGDNAIRLAKTQLREVIAVEHEMASSGQTATTGQHKQVTLQEQADLGTGAVSATILGSQTIDGKGELVYTDEDDNDIQITKAGALAGSTAAELLAVVGPVLMPVGFIYANASNSENPNTTFGFGTWVAIEEEVIAGYKVGGTFDPVGSLATGSETHTITEAQLPAHKHTYTTIDGAGSGGTMAANGQAGVAGHTYDTSTIGSGDAINIIQPTYVAYLWRRTL